MQQFKGTVLPKTTYIFLLPIVLAIQMVSVWRYDCRDVRPILNIIELNKILLKTLEQCLVPEIMTCLLKIISRLFCEQFHVGLFFELDLIKT